MPNLATSHARTADEGVSRQCLLYKNHARKSATPSYPQSSANSSNLNCSYVYDETQESQSSFVVTTRLPVPIRSNAQMAPQGKRLYFQAMAAGGVGFVTFGWDAGVLGGVLLTDSFLGAMNVMRATTLAPKGTYER